MSTAPESDGALAAGETSPELIRPSFWPLIKYWYGGALPRRHSAWVLHDVTCRTWALRHFARWIFLVIAPFFTIYMLVVPGSFALRLYTGITFSSTILMVSMLHILIDTDRRAVLAGYAYKEPGRVRTQRSQDAHRLAVAARREKAAQRHDRRLG